MTNALVAQLAPVTTNVFLFSSCLIIFIVFWMKCRRKLQRQRLFCSTVDPRLDIRFLVASNCPDTLTVVSILRYSTNAYDDEHLTYSENVVTFYVNIPHQEMECTSLVSLAIVH